MSAMFWLGIVRRVRRAPPSRSTISSRPCSSGDDPEIETIKENVDPEAVLDQIERET